MGHPFSRAQAFGFVAALGLAAAGIGASQIGCEQDVVLPSVASPVQCGNGILEPGEECDNHSIGCVACKAAPEWTCNLDNACSPNCDDPGVESVGGACVRKATCNMEGYWAIRESDYTTPPLAGFQSATQWYLYHVTQAPDATRYYVDTALDCGIHVTGDATVDYTPNTQRSLMYASGIDVGPHAPRKGDAESVAGGCKVSLDRFFFVRGAVVDTYLPKDFDNDASLPSNAAEPWLGAPPLPAQTPGMSLTYDRHFPPGAVNIDGVSDGGVAYPGGGFRITGDIAGLRHSAQRDYKGYASTDPIRPGALSFTFFGNYSLQESVLSITDCATAISCAFLKIIAPPTPDKPPFVTFSFIGLLPTSPRTASVIGTQYMPKQNYDNDLVTCQNLRLILPHDESLHDGSAAPDGSAP